MSDEQRLSDQRGDRPFRRLRLASYWQRQSPVVLSCRLPVPVRRPGQEPQLLGGRLVALRSLLDVSQDELAAVSQTSARTIQRIESGAVRLPRRATLLRLARGLGLLTARRMLAWGMPNGGRGRSAPTLHWDTADDTSSAP